MEKDEANSLLKLYEETGKLLSTFFDWRYKIMNRFFLMLAAIFVSVQWMYSTPSTKHLMYIPFLLGGILSILLAMMDRVNQRIINNCYKSGLAAEEKLFSIPGIYAHFDTDFKNTKTRKTLSYRVLLQVLYWGSGILLFLCSLVAFLKVG